MTSFRFSFVAVIFAAALALTALPHSARAATASDIQQDSAQALRNLYRINPLAESLSHKAKGILVFPNIVKGGFFIGGSYGEGELIEGGHVTGYYSSASGSIGFQLGAQTYSYVMFLMNDKALRYLKETKGWEVGVGPTVVIVDTGAAKNFSTTTMKDDAYAFIFGQQGLMAGVSLEGSKISHIDR